MAGWNEPLSLGWFAVYITDNTMEGEGEKEKSKKRGRET
jgi:hypothetical protein